MSLNIVQPIEWSLLTNTLLHYSRLLDMLLDVNNSAQIPFEKRIDLSLDPPSDPDALCLDIDRRPSTPTPGRKSYKKLLAEVPHSPFASARERFPDLMADLDAGRDSPADPNQGMPHPPSFLMADDIDNYIFEVDLQYAKRRAASMAEKDPGYVPDMKDLLLPTLAPVAVAARDNDYNIPASMQLAPREVAVRNSTSVYNWLRKNAPKTFLQDGEAHADIAGTEDAGQDGHAKSGAAGRGGGRGSRGGGVDRGERGRGSVRGKKTGAGRARAKEPVDDAMDLDDDGAGGAMTPTESKKGGGKRKRVVDDDPGYRPKGGSSRPAKKKKKSLGAEADLTATPTATVPKKPKKAAVALEKEHDPEIDDDDEEEHDAITARTGDD